MVDFSPPPMLFFATNALDGENDTWISFNDSDRVEANCLSKQWKEFEEGNEIQIRVFGVRVCVRVISGKNSKRKNKKIKRIIKKKFWQCGNTRENLVWGC